MMRWIQRILALSAMTGVLFVLGLDLDKHSWALWSVMGIAWVLEHLAYQHGVVRGIEIYMSMTPQQQQDIKKIFKDI